MPFEQGVSGNPKGRPKGASRQALLTKYLNPAAPELIQKLIDLALAGDMAALKLCIERIIPKATANDLAESLSVDLKALKQASPQQKANVLVEAAITGEISLSTLKALTDVLFKADKEEFNQLLEKMRGIVKQHQLN